MKKLIAIDNGHGRHTAGKRTPPFEDGGFFNEWEFNYPTAKKLGELLKYNGFEIIYVSNTDEDTPLKNRAKIANNANADILVSIHYNAYKGIWGDHGALKRITTLLLWKAKNWQIQYKNILLAKQD